MNLLFLLKPKNTVDYILEEDTLQEALGKLRTSGFTAAPVISKEGKYVGTVTEGDFLWNILKSGEEILDKLSISDIIKNGWNQAASEGEDEQILIELALSQNFVPFH